MTDAIAAVDEKLKEMADAAHALIGTIDRQTYDEYKRHDWDPPDDCEFLLTLRAKDLLLLDKILDRFISAVGQSRAALAEQSAGPTKAEAK